MSSPQPPPDDELQATVAMPRVTPPPPPPPTARRIDPAIVEPAEPIPVTPSAPTGPPPAAGHAAPGSGPTPQPAPAAWSTAPHQPASAAVIPPAAAVIPPRQTVVAARPKYEFGHPVGYMFARFFAFVIDIGLVSAVVTSLAYSLIAINPITGLPTNSQRGFDWTVALGIAFALVYVWVAESALGTTIGKLALGLHVFAVRGGAVGLGRGFVRNLVRPLDALLIGGLLAVLPGHRTLGDLAAGTIVARSRLRGFAPLIGWVLVIVVAGAPFILAGVPRTFQSFFAFVQFMPGLVSRIAVDIQRLLHLL